MAPPPAYQVAVQDSCYGFRLTELEMQNRGNATQFDDHTAPPSHSRSVTYNSYGGSTAPTSCSVAPASRGGSVAPPSRGSSVAPMSCGGSVAPMSRGGSVAPTSSMLKQYY